MRAPRRRRALLLGLLGVAALGGLLLGSVPRGERAPALPLSAAERSAAGPADLAGPPGARSGAAVDASSPSPARAPLPRRAIPEHASVSGRVLAADGTPAAGARVELLELCPGALSPTWRVRRAVRTDSAGRFRLERLEPFVEVPLHVRAAGHLTSFVTARPDVWTEVRLQAARRVRGRLVDGTSGAPLPGASLMEPPGWLDFELDHEVSITDAAGRFELPWVAAGTRVLDLRVAVPGRIAVTRRLALDPDPVHEHEIRVDAGRPLRLVVVDALSGEPLARERIELGRRSGELAWVETTDELGTLVVDCPEGFFQEGFFGRRSASVTLRAPQRGWVTVEFDEEDLGPGPGLSVPLPPAWTLAGRVVDGGGRPVGGTWIELETAAPDRRGPPERVRPDPATVVATDDEGRFLFRGLSATEGSLTLHAESMEGAEARLEVQLDGSDLDPLELVLRRPRACVTGRVTREGAPVRAVVTWRQDGEEGRQETNDLGEYLLRGLAPGEVELEARARDAEEQRSLPRVGWVPEDGVLQQDLALVTPPR